jgi:anti-anti-sigma factor
LGALKQARQFGGDLKICCLNKRVMEIFSTAGLDHIFEIYATRADAERAFGKDIHE